jgi:NAD(P)-dependent dehydrogenase (short-subunit alcohol dehydrogenase family)
MSLLASIRGGGPSGFGYGSTAEEVTAGLDLSGKRYLVTGGTSGLGAETVRVLALRGADVLATGRTLEKARAAYAPLGARARPVELELSEPSSVRSLVAELSAEGQPLDGIICNAGIMALPKLTLKYGIELQFLTNHLGHFLLVTGLLPLLAANGRVVMLSSDAHRAAPRRGVDFDNLDGSRGYRAWTFYGQTKVANLLFAKALAKRLDGGRTANAVHPGVIVTKLQRSMPAIATKAMVLTESIFLKSAAQGAATTLYVATHPSLTGVTGEYFADCNLARPRRVARDPDLAERLWMFSEEFAARHA